MNSNGYKVLVVDDEADIVDLLRYNLEKEGYIVITGSDGNQAVSLAKEHDPDLIMLDIMMPGVDGVEACRLIRELPNHKDTYIVFLTARTEEYSEMAAFDVGADDYITKPIKPRALVKRLGALFRREVKKASSMSDVIKVGDLEIDKVSYTLTVKEEEVQMPKKEFELLTFLAENPGKVFNRDELLDQIWGSDVYVLSRTVDVHIRRIREKIGEDYIVTIKGVGYKFDATE